MTTKADGKRRVVLPGSEPGDVYDVQRQGEGVYVLVRLQRPEPHKMSRDACLQAMDASPLRPRSSWEELAALTREP
ncbi:MAG TPA: hypothetical protein VMS86_12100 [Thermoanaerobaculia bacterium]|nr:hypothetical protein [Thermoanaerobaculia bacterium]